MGNKKWYNWKMSKINQKPNWQSKNNNDDFTIPESDTNVMTESESTINIEPKIVQQDQGLDVNLIIAGFQEKLSQTMTELVVKDATIKQLLLQIEKLKGR